MNFYYDIYLNFNEDNVMFYEWEDEQNIEYFKKLPLFLVSSNTIKNIVNNNIMVEKDFLKKIKNKNSYIAILTDKNSALALEFNEEGKSISRSFLELEDELNIIDNIYTLKIEKIKYKVLEKIKYHETLRLEDKIKRFIKTEINSLIKEKDYQKLNYIYMEWFKSIPDDKEDIFKKIKEKLKEEITDTEIKIYNLIKLSYSNV